jgi:glycerophosphoryl diester phosphodiesterase
MLDDGVTDAAGIFHELGVLVDVWTLDAGARAWRPRLERVLEAGVDIVTTNTPQALAAAARAS